ncbi:hypothetical protein Avbf_06946 [Armadillidium vulgare]|nr:hypothetical protein Avbf_06946 [Armadillidium vulgare]
MAVVAKVSTSVNVKLDFLAIIVKLLPPGDLPDYTIDVSADVVMAFALGMGFVVAILGILEDGVRGEDVGKRRIKGSKNFGFKKVIMFTNIDSIDYICKTNRIELRESIKYT